MFTQKDLRQIEEKGIHLDDINRQIKYFQEGFPPADIILPATPGKGILCLSEGEEQYYQDVFLHNGPDNQMTRFIPASGAATRMFKALYAARDKLDTKGPEQQWKWVQKKKEIKRFFKKLRKYPFYEDLDLPDDAPPARVLDRLLGEKGLNYGNLPKGLLKFHKYSPEDRRTALEEHIREAVKYCRTRQGEVKIHLTILPDHLEGFREEARRIATHVEKDTGLSLDVSFSFQQPETDTIAVDPDNQPFRKSDGRLLFRPGGHGALIRNLNDLDSDLIFISNIDNVAPDRLKNFRVKHKQVLAGFLLEVRSKVHYYLQQLSANEKLEKTRMDHMVAYLHDRLGLPVPDQLENWSGPQMRQWLIRSMNRPIRVCGMVRNEGEPGGGPFYVRSESGEESLQIVEASQVDLANPAKKAVMMESTHFNPVDLVCSTRDFQGNRFNLTRYVDHNTGFISEKSVEGRSIKALELPGLWNGAMARWLTLFVEVPTETFSPVKTVFDLLRKEHRPRG